MFLSPHYPHLNYNETPRKYGFKALSRHWLCRPQYNPPGGNTQICSCSSPAILPYLHLCSIVHDTGECMHTHIQPLTHTHTLYSKVHHMHTRTQLRTPRRAARESQSAWLGQLSCEVSYSDWTYADPFRFLFCADLLVGASSCHDFVLSFAGKGGVGAGVSRCTECVRVWLRTMLVSGGLVGFACACLENQKAERRDRNVGSEERANFVRACTLTC